MNKTKHHSQQLCHPNLLRIYHHHRHFIQSFTSKVNCQALSITAPRQTLPNHFNGLLQLRSRQRSNVNIVHHHWRNLNRKSASNMRMKEKKTHVCFVSKPRTTLNSINEKRPMQSSTEENQVHKRGRVA